MLVPLMSPRPAVESNLPPKFSMGSRFPTMRPGTTPREDRLSRSHLQPLAMGNLRFQELFVQPHLSTTLTYHVKKN